MYSKVLYMARVDRKHRVTFRVAPEIAEALRQLPSQAAFVEAALREALGKTCPLCLGRGRLPTPALAISDFRAAELPRIDRASALQLRELVRLGKRLCATDLVLDAGGGEGALAFRLVRKDELLLAGRVGDGVRLDVH
jgi:hypothetical protein